MRNHNEPVAWRWDQATTEGDWLTAFSEHGEPVPSSTVRTVTPLYSCPTDATNEKTLNNAAQSSPQEVKIDADPAANLTPEQHRHAQFMGGIGDEEWD